ncbi:MAG: helix-turn-helix domain-containing protein [Oscillospiraceae bacterium]|nr:helix-turn-helix domain-containing protein [Oscillospiraceae bacterium]
MERYITAATIKQRREAKGITQAQLAHILCVSDKTVSKWETGRGYPDISLLQPLATALDISTIELLSGYTVTNQNRGGNMLRSRFYVCPVCGNVIHATGGAVISCCGITLPPMEAESTDADHLPTIEMIEDEWYVTVNHPMTKEHYISFMAVMYDNGIQITKLYPEGVAEARFRFSRAKGLYLLCNRHGLYKIQVRSGKPVL